MFKVPVLMKPYFIVPLKVCYPVPGSLNVVLADRQALEAIVLFTIVCSKMKIFSKPIQKQFHTDDIC